MARKAKASTMLRANKFGSSKMTLATLAMLDKRGFRPAKGSDSSESYIHDFTSPSYSWLLPGWLAEERVVANKRLYKYYYDPSGRQYRAKYEVLELWEKLGLVVLDLD